MLAKSISISERVSDLSDFTALLFTWMIPHADDWGILPGSPKKIKALVIPMRRQSANDVDKALGEIESAKLIWRYEVDGERYIQFRKWEKHQDGLHKRTTPKSPPFPGTSEKFPESPDDSEDLPEIPGQQNRTEQNRKELIYSVFQYWNSKKIIEHRELTDKLKGHINAKLGNYAEQEILDAIDNYAKILFGEEYFFSYKWTLEEFLTRSNGFLKFLTVNEPLNNYKKDRGKQQPKSDNSLPSHWQVV